MLGNFATAAVTVFDTCRCRVRETDAGAELQDGVNASDRSVFSTSLQRRVKHAKTNMLNGTDINKQMHTCRHFGILPIIPIFGSHWEES